MATESEIVYFAGLDQQQVMEDAMSWTDSQGSAQGSDAGYRLYQDDGHPQSTSEVDEAFLVLDQNEKKSNDLVPKKKKKPLLNLVQDPVCIKKPP